MLRFLPKGTSRLLNAGVHDHRLAGRIRKQIDLWIGCSGLEWTTSRLKAYREAAYQLKAGNPDMARAIYQINSIAYQHSTLVPKGPWGFVVRGFVSAKKPSTIRKYDALLRMYTSLRLPSLSQRQFIKAKTAINSPFILDERAEKLCSSLERHMETWGARLRKLSHFESPVGEDGKVTIDLSKLHPTTSTHSDMSLVMDCKNPISDNSWGRHICSIWTSVWVPDCLKAINPAEKLRELLEKSGSNGSVAGHIAFIQEGGCKGRVVAVPNAWIQVLMRPLHLSLDRLSNYVRQSVVHDQNRGVYFAKRHMENGDLLYCKDLSSATDRFPRRLQTALLRGLGLGVYAQAIEEISTAPWLAATPDKGVTETWSYPVGQPMGLYSSFPLFNLTHIALLDVCNLVLKGKGKRMGDFRILGDDCIMVGKDLADLYSSTLSILGVKFSEAKCIESSTLAEFAGFSIHRTNKGVTAHRPFKYSGRNGFGAALPLLDSFGKDTRSLGPWYSKKLDLFYRTKSWRNPDLSPFFNPVEEDDQPGTVNLNSHRLGSLSNRLNYCLDFVPTDSLLDCYEEQQIILLGQKEIVSEGFASANLNTSTSPGRKPDDVSVSQVQPWEAHKVQLSSDPLMKPDSAELLRTISTSTAFSKEESKPSDSEPMEPVEF